MARRPRYHWIAKPLRGLAVPISSLKADPANARVHTPKNREAARASLIRFGQRLPLIVRENGMEVIVGNLRLELAEELGWTHIAAVVLDDDAATARAYAIADNRIGELGEWDDVALARALAELRVLDEGDEALDAIGFSEAEVGRMVAALEREMDEIEETILDEEERDRTPPPSPDHVPAAPEHVKVIQLFVPSVALGSYRTRVEILRRHLGTETESETVLRSLEELVEELDLEQGGTQ